MLLAMYFTRFYLMNTTTTMMMMISIITIKYAAIYNSLPHTALIFDSLS